MLVCSYKFFRHLITACNPPAAGQIFLTRVRDDIHPDQVGTRLTDREINQALAALTEAWNKRPKT